MICEHCKEETGVGMSHDYNRKSGEWGCPSLPDGERKPWVAVRLLQTENAKLRAEVVHHVTALKAANALLDKVAAEREDALLQVCAMREVVKWAREVVPMIEDHYHTEQAELENALAKLDGIEKPACGKHLLGSTEYLPKRCEFSSGHSGDCAEKQPPPPGVERDLGPSLQGGAAPVNFTEKQIERCQKCGVAHEPKEQPFCSE
jgi:hypothetical protein